MPIWITDFLSWIEAHPGTAGWMQAGAATIAVLIAILVPSYQQHLVRRDARAAGERRRREDTRRLVAAIRAEIVAAIEAADRQYQAAAQMLSNLERARANGVTIKDEGPPDSDDMIITDAIIYRQLAQDLGHLPPRLIAQVIEFYTAALDIPRVAATGSLASGCYEVMRDLAPRLKRDGQVVLALLDNFEKSNFAADADLTLTPEQSQAITQSQVQ